MGVYAKTCMQKAYLFIIKNFFYWNLVAQMPIYHLNPFSCEITQKSENGTQLKILLSKPL